MAKKCDKQATLMDIDPDWKKEWEGMPEFNMGNTEPIQKITISFKNREDVRKFGELIGQRLSPRTDSIWFPKQECYIAPKSMRYVDEP